MNEIKLIGIDLDGTLFDVDKNISEENKTAMKKAADKGICILPITGRPISAVPDFVYEAVPADYVAASGGAMIYRLPEKKLIYEDLISKEVARAAVKALAEHDFLVSLFVDGKGYVAREDYELAIAYAETPALKEYYCKYRIPVPDLLALLDEQEKNPEKLTATFYQDHRAKENGQEEMLRVLAPFAQELEIMYGAGMNTEITKKTATKGNALRYMSGLLRIPLSQMMGIGDSDNDRCMFEVTGLSVAMENAEPKVQANADFITADNDHSGVARAIERFCL